MSGHTPGPWDYRHNSGYGDFILTAAGDIQVIGGCGCCESPFLDGDDPEADARLIAAAPDLLHCLKVILDHAEGREDWEVALHLDKAREAVAKAEGKA